MKRMFIFAVVAVCFAARQVPGWTEAETNAVTRWLVRNIVMSASGDCEPIEDPNDVQGDIPNDELLSTVESLFTVSGDGDPSHGWTIDEKRAAFDNYISTFSGIQDEGLRSNAGVEAAYILNFCDAKGYTNALGSAKEVLAATNTPAICRRAAANVFKKFADSSDETMEYIQSVLTNSNCLSDYNTRIAFFDSTIAKLNAACDRGATNAVRRVASTLLGVLDGDPASMSLDGLLLRVCDGYGGSSNRLAIACGTLSAHPENQVAFLYFSPITNLLLNAAQPLPAVEGL